ncbi:unnamed protein product, partial [Didymodactylos carnosus]
DEITLPRLSFDHKLAAHHYNRIDQTFGQQNIPFSCGERSHSVENHDTVLPILYRCKTPQQNARSKTYENTCEMLDLSSDWQIRILLQYDNISISNRSFSFNDIRAFSSAIEANENLETLTLQSVGLTSRSTTILCKALQKCIHLVSLDISNNKIGKEGLMAITQATKYLRSLTHLSLA